MKRLKAFLAGGGFFFAAALIAAACGEAPRSRTAPSLISWAQPESPAIRLVSLDGRVDGETEAPEVGVLARWSGDGLADEWEVDSSPEALVLTLAVVPGSEVPQSVRVTLRPGRAEQLVIKPHVYRSETEGREVAFEKIFRTIGIPIPKDADPDKPLTLSFPFREAVVGNWFDAAAPGRLESLRITVSGRQPAISEIEEIVFIGTREALKGSAAAPAPVEIGGIVRPAWMVAEGTRVEFEIDVPERAPILRWYDGALGDVGPRVVTVRKGTASTPVGEPQGDGTWEAHEARLDRWAGERISLILETRSAAASGTRGGSGSPHSIGVFGTPEISSGPTPNPPPDILVYLIDALRADRVGAWGHPQAKTPNLDRLSAEGATFRNLISSSCWTKPAVATLMTGTEPTTHGVGSNSFLDSLPDGAPVLQGRFAEAGWRTGSFTANPLGSNLTKLERGFDAAYLPRSWVGRIGPFLHPTAGQLHESLLGWVDEAPDRPFFAYVHTLEVHQSAMPYNIGHGTESMSLYDKAVNRADTLLGELLEGLRKRGRLDNLVVVLVSDHGESLGEHGILGHGQSLYQTETHVPLIFWSPGRIPAANIEAPVAIADICPTLLELSDLAPMGDSQGVSLDQVLRGEPSPPHRIVFSSHSGLAIFPGTQRQNSLVTADHRKLLRVEGLRDYAFDLSRDPRENQPSTEVPEALLASLEGWLADQLASRSRFELEYGAVALQSVVVDPEDLRSLRSLGYLP